jgi:PAS domain S-box-containing protein
MPDSGPELQWKSIELGVASWFLQETSDMVFLIKLPDGQIVDSNRSASMRLGYIASELFGMSIFDILPPEASSALGRFVEGSGRPDRDEVIYAALRRKMGAELPVTIKSRLVSSNLVVLAAFPFQPGCAEETLARSGLELHNAVEKLLAETAEKNRLSKELRECQDELRAVPLKLMNLRAADRKMFVTEVQGKIEHISKTLNSCFQVLLSAQDRRNPAEASKLLETFLSAYRHSMEEALSLCTAFKPKMPDKMGIVDTLEWFCNDFRGLYPALGIQLRIGLKEEQIPESLKISIFRIVQEGLDNVARHSKAQRVDVSLAEKKDLVELTIADNGIGMDLGAVFDEQHNMGRGLARIWERAGLTGGSLSIESFLGEGTTIRCCWSSREVVGPV